MHPTGLARRAGVGAASSVSPMNSLTSRACRCVPASQRRRTPSTSRGARIVVRAPPRTVRSALGGLLARSVLRFDLSPATDNQAVSHAQQTVVDDQPATL